MNFTCNWVISFGSQVEVIKPDWLKNDIKTEIEIENALRHYSR